MNSCSTCGLCYSDPTNINREASYRCMRGLRPPISDFFILGRTVCDKYAPLDPRISPTTK